MLFAMRRVQHGLILMAVGFAAKGIAVVAYQPFHPPAPVNPRLTGMIESPSAVGCI
jgi:hypothetical protein